MKVFVISLKRAANRRKYIQAHLEALQLDYEIIDAIDYKDLTREELIKQCDTAAITGNSCLTDGPIACMLSHLQVYRTMLDRGLNKALIVEDDVVLADDIKMVLNRVAEDLSNSEMISLAYRSNDEEILLSNKGIVTYEDGAALAIPNDIRHIGLGMAYIISDKVAGKLIDLAYPVHATADSWYKFFKLGIYDAIRCYYPVAALPAPQFNTTLDYPGTSAFKNGIIEWIKSTHLPFLSKFLKDRFNRTVSQTHRVSFTDCIPFNEQA